MDERECLKPEYTYAIMARYFPIWYFLVLLLLSPGVCSPQGLHQVLLIIFSCYSFIHSFSISVIFFLFPYFTPKLSCLCCIWLFICHDHPPPTGWQFSFAFWKVFCYFRRSCIFLLFLSRYLLTMPSFKSFDLFLSVVLSNLSAVALLNFFSFPWVPVLFISLSSLWQLHYLPFYPHFPSRFWIFVRIRLGDAFITN